ncbi:MAG: glycogen debranching protein GlgX [Treponemataceae bacterium]|nr:glycogen debranching protein GlgX [Treponemataceae bacterium]
MAKIQVLPGKPLKPGIHVTKEGVNFSIFSRHATAVFLELFHNANDAAPFMTVALEPETNRIGDIWFCFVAGLKPGDLYLYRVDGPFAPEKGHRFNKKFYLFDPRARAFTEGSVFKNMAFGQVCPLEKMPKCVIVDSDDYDWEGDRPLGIPLEDSIIYEAHLKGFTAAKSSKVKYGGTYRGLIEKIPYLKSLGITAVELLPVQEFDEYENANVNPRTGERMVNYWGYSTIGFFAPKVHYAVDRTPGAVVNEFKDMVKALHKAGVEVILDIVFNHTAEGNEHGVTLNFRGFDNAIFYALVPDNKQYYLNYSGCGNTINCNHPINQEFIMDCLRYWVVDMHVDGFRFDLASVLCRAEDGSIIKYPPLTDRIAEDPLLRGAKIIAEPWDCGGAYFVGSFPGSRWSEWNDRYRDGIRRFIRGDEFTSAEAATRISGSNDLYAHSHRGPQHSINYIVSHDGFTLNDLVTYNGKHNEENGENNRDGNDNNLSYNHGFEGPTANPKIERLRQQQIKNFFVCLMLSQGTPMMVAGDEVNRTQGGNNNAYCQDNEISWFDWDDVKKNAEMLTFAQRLIALRKNHPVFHRTSYFGGAHTATPTSQPDISWHDYDGKVPDWEKMNRFLALRLGGNVGQEKADSDFYLAFNTDIHDKTLVIPPPSSGRKWYRSVDTSIAGESAALAAGTEEILDLQEKYVLPANSVLVLISK